VEEISARDDWRKERTQEHSCSRKGNEKRAFPCDQASYHIWERVKGRMGAPGHHHINCEEKKTLYNASSKQKKIEGRESSGGETATARLFGIYEKQEEYTDRLSSNAAQRGKRKSRLRRKGGRRGKGDLVTNSEPYQLTTGGGRRDASSRTRTKEYASKRRKKSLRAADERRRKSTTNSSVRLRK